MNYKSANLIPGWNTSGWEIITGNASVDASGVTLGTASAVKLTLTSSDAVRASSMLKLVTKFKGVFGTENDYSPVAYIEINITYTDGSKQDIRVVFDTSVIVGQLTYYDVTEIAVEGKTCSSVVINFVNESDYDLVLVSTELYKSEDINTEQVKEAVSKDVQLASLTAYEGSSSSGCIAVWKGDPVPTHIEFLVNTSGGFGGLLVNGSDFIPFDKVIGNLPAFEEE